MSHIVIAISSGIAAYKIKDLISTLRVQKHDVQVIMTEKAVHFISPEKVKELTGHKVFIHLFEKKFTREAVLKSRKIDHIEIAKQADLFVIAPATANTIAKLANGVADDFLTTTLLATQAPVLVCPSMNTQMWFHPATKRNLRLIESYGYELLKPDSGSLACGTHGIGRLPDIQVIATKIKEVLARKKLLQGKKVLVTSGGTVEPIDNARVITNRSSGKMGKALAEATYRYGAEVTLIHAQHAATPFLPIRTIPFQTSADLSAILEKETPRADIIFHVAAVSDFTVKKTLGKMKSGKALNLPLMPTRKIIDTIKKWNPNIVLIGFKAISLNDLEPASTARLGSSRLAKRGEPVPKSYKYEREIESKKLFTNARADFIIINDISRPDIGFESDENEVMIVSRKGNITQIPKNQKSKIAAEIIRFIFR